MFGKPHMQKKFFVWVWFVWLFVELAGVSQASGPGDTPAHPMSPGLELAPPPNPLSVGPESDASDDPPGLFNDQGLEPIANLAAWLSSHSDWLVPEITKTLDELSLRPDEIFSTAPRYFSINGQIYTIKIDQVGNLWDDFRPGDSYCVFLTHEVFDAMGVNRVLGFRDGVERAFSTEDLELCAAVGLTVAEVTPDDIGEKSISVVDLDNEPIELGKVRLEVKRDKYPSADAKTLLATKSGCAHEVGLSSCVGGAIPVCLPGSEPYFVLNKLLIKTDHEDLFSGKPEIELYQLSFEDLENPPDHPTTAFIFDGRYSQDAIGRSRFLPDVNNTHQWYEIDGAALFPLNLGGGWVADLIEDDKVKGELRQTGTLQLTVKIFGANGVVSYQPVTLEELGFLENSLRIVVNFFAGAGDDFYQRPLGLTNFFGCTSGLGSSVLTLDTDEWTIQGNFSCIDPSCIQFGVSIAGPPLVEPGQLDTWTANVTSGVAPFTYHWTKQTGTTVVNLGSGTSVSTSSSSSFTLTCEVTDSAGQSATDDIFVKIFTEDPQDCPRCPPD